MPPTTREVFPDGSLKAPGIRNAKPSQDWVSQPSGILWMTVNTPGWYTDLKPSSVASVKSELCQDNGGDSYAYVTNFSIFILAK